MQRNIKNKVTFFTFGLLAGVTLGVVFGVAIKEVFSHLNALRSSLVSLGSKEDKIAQRIDSLEGKIQSQDKKTVVMVVKDNSKASQASSSNTSKSKVDSNSIKKVVKDGRDSVLSIEMNNDSNANTQNIVVMTNQLVTVSNVSLVDLDSIQDRKSDAARKSDSLAASMNEMGQAVYAPSKYRIEFWVSPINFRGYKMSIGKIILYGVSTKAPMKLVKLEDSYYLQTDQLVYKLGYTDDLRPFDKVTDKSILKKFSL